MGVTDLTSYREQRETEESPHISGQARCLRCQHEWICVAPVGTAAELECPNCGCDAGVLNATVAPEWVFCCDACDNDVYRLSPDGAICIACGSTTLYSELCED